MTYRSKRMNLSNALGFKKLLAGGCALAQSGSSKDTNFRRAFIAISLTYLNVNDGRQTKQMAIALLIGN